MNKFEVGDVVELLTIPNGDTEAIVGKIYTITSYLEPTYKLDDIFYVIECRIKLHTPRWLRETELYKALQGE